MTQSFAIILILTVATGYTGWRIRQLWTKEHNLCDGCDGCTMKKQVCDKKSKEKFG